MKKLKVLFGLSMLIALVSCNDNKISSSASSLSSISSENTLSSSSSTSESKIDKDLPEQFKDGETFISSLSSLINKDLPIISFCTIINEGSIIQSAFSRNKNEVLISQTSGILNTFDYYGYFDNAFYKVFTNPSKYKGSYSESSHSTYENAKIEMDNTLDTSLKYGIFSLPKSGTYQTVSYDEYNIDFSNDLYNISGKSSINRESNKTVYEYSYTFDINLRPTKISISYKYYNTSLGEDTISETPTFDYSYRLINFKYGELEESNKESLLINYKDYFVSSLIGTPNILSVHYGEYEESINDIQVNDTNISLDISDLSYLPSTAFDFNTNSLKITGISDESVICKDKYGTYKALKEGTVTLTCGTNLYPNLLTFDVTVNPGVEIIKNTAYFSYCYANESSSEKACSFDTTGQLSKINLTLNQEIELICSVNDSCGNGPFDFTALQEGISSSSEYIEVNFLDYEQYVKGPYFVMDIKGINKGSTTLKLMTSSSSYIEVEVSVN